MDTYPSAVSAVKSETGIALISKSFSKELFLSLFESSSFKETLLKSSIYMDTKAIAENMAASKKLPSAPQIS